jgi:serine/threonine protein phosphatase PrpC
MNHEPQASGFRLKIEFAQASDPGRDPNKQVNEDSCGYAETRFGHLCVLCDGMGGHYGGKEASRTAIATIFEVFEQIPLTTSPAQALKVAIEEAGRRVYRLGGPPENRTRPGSTVVAMLLHDRGLDVAHVGDSRAYIIRSNQIYPLTRDHSMVQGMIDAGMLTEESAMGHPDSNKITRALGMKPEVDVELRPEPMELFAGDVLLQSSDGLTDLALGRDILGATRQALASGGVEHACHMLVKMANDRGGHDNITVQMVRIGDVGAKPITTIPERPAGAPQPQETVQAAPLMMGPQAAPNPAPPAAAPYMAAAQPQLQQAPAGWGAPVMPTAPDAAPAPQGGLGGTMMMGPQAAPSPAFGHQPAPTLNEIAPPSKPWTSGQFAPLPPTPPAGPVAPTAVPPPVAPFAPAAPAPGPTVNGPSQPPPPGLAAYRLDAGPAALPLPPPSGRAFGQQQAYGGGTPMPAPAPSFGAPPVVTAAQGGLTPAPGGFAPPGGALPATAPASKGGIVYIIIGLSAVIAILILVVVWALWLR